VSINGQSEGSRVCIQKELISRRISPLSTCTYSAKNICVAFDNDHVFCQRRDGDGATLAGDDAGSTDQDGDDDVVRYNVSIDDGCVDNGCRDDDNDVDTICRY
jgi:hypothetical protein